MRFILMAFVVSFIGNHLGAQEIVDFEYSECDNSCDFERIIDRISYQGYNYGILKIGFGTISNCAGMFNPSVKYYQDTLRINYEDFKVTEGILEDGSEVEFTEKTTCDCYFESEYKISGLSKNPSVILLNDKHLEYHPDKYKIYAETFQILDGDTVNYKDKYGFEQGLWLLDFPFGGYSIGFQKDGKYITLERKLYHENGQLKSELNLDSLGRGFGKSFYEDGVIESIFVQTSKGQTTDISYYPNGNLRSQNLYSGEIGDINLLFHDNGNLKRISGIQTWNEYYETGTLQEQRLFSNNPENIWAIYYYESGETMAINYIEKGEFGQVKNRSWKYFDKTGNEVSKDALIEEGYSFLRD